MREDEIAGWVAEQLPAELRAVGLPTVQRYADELVIILALPTDEAEADPQALIAHMREETRALRMGLARDLERRLGISVAWGMRVGAAEQIFTSRTAPVMTRLGRMERDVLDTLVAAGVADTRSSALAYIVRSFAVEHGVWLGEVRQAIGEVTRVRARLKIRPRPGGPPTAVDP